jgi:NAD(P)-dependent dehydrogenase (short-subunit alcohol dehydrogenase family)
MRRLGLALGAGAAAAAVARRLSLRDLSGAVAMVTGGSRGLGFAIAQELAAEGATVAICARGEEALERARERLGPAALATRCDVADPAQVDAWVAEVLDRHGRVDVLVNNAGIISVGPMRAQRREDFERAMDTMFFGVLNPTLAVLPAMRRRGEGTIANVTSIGGKLAVPHLGSYTPAKFAAVGLSQALRAELAPDGIRIVTVVPWLLRTGSYLAAEYKGDRRLEYGLFAPLASAPLLTVDAGRAARRIIRAIRRGEAEVAVGAPAWLLPRLNGLAPATTARALALTARLLPDGSSSEPVPGREIDSPVDRTPLVALGKRAARDLNQQA